MKRTPLIVLALFLVFAFGVSWQLDRAQSASPPQWSMTCNNGDILTWSSTTKDFSCQAPSSGSIPSGMIAFIDTGTCPAGFTQDASFNGAYILGTVAANSDVGSSGGSNSYTPAGMVSQPTFTGNTLSGGTRKGGTTNPGSIIENGASVTGTISQPAFTGTGATITPVYLKVIACKAN